jgi:hypothetical protein
LSCQADLSSIMDFNYQTSSQFRECGINIPNSSLFRVGAPHPWMQFDKLGATTKTYLTGFTGLTG